MKYVAVSFLSREEEEEIKLWPQTPWLHRRLHACPSQHGVDLLLSLIYTLLGGGA